MAVMSTVNASLYTTVVLVSVYIAFLGLSVKAATINTASNGEAQAETISRKPYIVHMIKSMKPQPFRLHKHWYASLLREVSGLQFDPSQFLYTYNHALDGFAASLTTAEAQALESKQSCLVVTLSSVYQTHTTHSPEFLGLSFKAPTELYSLSNYGEDAIVGVIDSGIWPESKSFDDAGLSPVPARWKGQCESGVMFNSSNCNKKIIGARYFAAGYEAEHGKININLDYRSPRGIDSHGTHTASTVAGSPAPWSNFSGFANGTAMGMAPRARLAIYKVLWGSKGKGNSVDVVAAVDKAIEDGVDILSMSIGGGEFHEGDIATLNAVKKGVFVSMSGGNHGPAPFTLSNTAPWVTTVGASSIDREFPAPVTLGNLEMYKGSSFYKGSGVENLPFVYASYNQSSMNCLPGSLLSNVVKNKVVLCDKNSLSSVIQQGKEVKRAGGAAMILANSQFNGGDDSDSVSLNRLKGLPATMVSFLFGQKIKAYINSASIPTVSINTSGSTAVGRTIRAPIVAAFSSRGPSKVFPDVLKPDLIAPGTLILAASTQGGYEIMSGTSMACPHVSGIAALIKSAHPSWSPAAIRSALMTSSYIRDNTRQLIKDVVDLKPATPFAMGAGHLNPGSAMDPGLVYDMGFQDYVDFLCSRNKSNKHIALFIKNTALFCPKSSESTPMEEEEEEDTEKDLNNPSFSVMFTVERAQTVEMRTLTNVAQGSAEYKVTVKSPPHVKIRVMPPTLKFEKHNDKKSYRVIFQSEVDAKGQNEHQESGRIIWKCIEGGDYTVPSPVMAVWYGE